MGISVFLYVLVTFVVVLGSMQIWRHFEKKRMNSEKIILFPEYICEDQVMKLEILLNDVIRDKNEIELTLLNLVKKVDLLVLKVDSMIDINKSRTDK